MMMMEGKEKAVPSTRGVNRPGARSGRKNMARAVSAARGEAERKEVGGWVREKREASGALDDNRRLNQETATDQLATDRGRNRIHNRNLAFIDHRRNL